MKKKCLEHQTHGRWVICPGNPANIGGFLVWVHKLSSLKLNKNKELSLIFAFSANSKTQSLVDFFKTILNFVAGKSETYEKALIVEKPNKPPVSLASAQAFSSKTVLK